MPCPPRRPARRACFPLRVIEAPQSAAAQPASASLWDLLLGWLA